MLVVVLGSKYFVNTKNKEWMCMDQKLGRKEGQIALKLFTTRPSPSNLITYV